MATLEELTRGAVVRGVLPDALVRVVDEVMITLEIDVQLADGAPEQAVRTVSENCRTLKFASQGFEEQ